nr:MAG TPA: hypothetical protein [Caudoviricetes sp.]
MPPKLTIAATLELPHELRPRVLVIDVRKREGISLATFTSGAKTSIPAR